MRHGRRRGLHRAAVGVHTLVTALPLGVERGRSGPPPQVLNVDGPGYPPSRGRPLVVCAVWHGDPAAVVHNPRSRTAPCTSVRPAMVDPDVWGDRGAMQSTPPTVIGVLGLSGGTGSSCLATALAVRAARAGRGILLVDGHPYAGGLDLLVGDDLGPGLHWPDLVTARGDLDGAALWARLPRLGSCAVLSWDRLPPPQDVLPSGAPVWQVLAAHADLTVVDLPSLEARCWPEWVMGCTDVVLLVGGGVGGVASAMVGCDRLADTPRPPHTMGAVVRGSGQVPVEAISRALAVPVVGVLPDDSGVDRALTRGEPVGAQGSPLTDLVDLLLVDHLCSGRGVA